MAKIDEFKQFVRTKPALITFVKKGDTTWQKLFETWSLYGEDDDIWQKYVLNNPSSISNVGLGDLVNSLRNVNMDAVSKGVNGLQNLLSLVQEMTTKKTALKEPYVPRPMYKQFED
ncbi:MAG: spore coat protein YlbD [Bacilli bacterium]|jgi:hypothetical protein|nr:spore coat protein YlbD [Bacilli bacterium]